MHIKDEADPVKGVSNLSSTDVRNITTCFREGLVRLLNEEVDKLNRAYESMQRMREDASKVHSSKFALSGMESGHIGDFHSGLSGRIGDPHLDFLNAMEAEHCVVEGSKTLFTTRNYGVTTCAYNEWRIAVHNETSLADMCCGKRRIPQIEALLQHPVVTSADLWRAEVTAVVLYTGPMVGIVKSCFFVRSWRVCM